MLGNYSNHFLLHLENSYSINALWIVLQMAPDGLIVRLPSNIQIWEFQEKYIWTNQKQTDSCKHMQITKRNM